MFDAAIIGPGPAGVSAALNLKIHNKSFIWVGSKRLSDKVTKAEQISNYPGFINASGEELNAAFLKQIEAMGIGITEGMVNVIYPMGDHYALSIGADFAEAKTLILATGVAPGNVLPGEAELVGRGVSYCATCDGMLYRKKPVAVVGYSDSAKKEAEFLTSIGCTVTYFDRPKTCEISGGAKAERVTCDGQTAEVACVFLLRPALAPTDMFPGIAVENGYVKVDRAMATNLPGVFAAGDCTGGPLQVSKAAGEGLVAGQSAAKYVADLTRKK